MPSSASESASTKAAAVGNLCTGFLASARANTASTASGRSACSEAGGTISWMWAAASAVGDSRSKGRLPVRSS